MDGWHLVNEKERENEREREREGQIMCQDK